MVLALAIRAIRPQDADVAPRGHGPGAVGVGEGREADTGRLAAGGRGVADGGVALRGRGLQGGHAHRRWSRGSYLDLGLGGAATCERDLVRVEEDAVAGTLVARAGHRGERDAERGHGGGLWCGGGCGGCTRSQWRVIADRGGVVDWVITVA